MNRFVAPMPQMSAMDSTLGPQPVLEPALLGDMARMFRQLGIESFRASVVDMGSMAFQAAWTITDSGEVSDNNPDKPLDSQFPGAMATITQLADAPAEQTVVQRLSPRRWTFAWRIDSLHVVIAEARYRTIPNDVWMALPLPPKEHYINLNPNCFQLMQVPALEELPDA